MLWSKTCVVNLSVFVVRILFQCTIYLYLHPADVASLCANACLLWAMPAAEDVFRLTLQTCSISGTIGHDYIFGCYGLCRISFSFSRGRSIPLSLCPYCICIHIFIFPFSFPFYFGTGYLPLWCLCGLCSLMFKHEAHFSCMCDVFDGCMHLAAVC